MITVAKQTARDIGIFADPSPKTQTSLEKEGTDFIARFYELDSNSRMMPRIKDLVAVKVNN